MSDERHDELIECETCDGFGTVIQEGECEDSLVKCPDCFGIGARSNINQNDAELYRVMFQDHLGRRNSQFIYADSESEAVEGVRIRNEVTFREVISVGKAGSPEGGETSSHLR